LWALAIATLAPSVAHALRHARGEMMPWSQLCSATGGKRVVFESPSADPGSTPRAHTFEQCGFCVLHGGGLAPPAAAVAVALRLGLRAAVPPPRPLQALRPFAWLHAQPRAPPEA